MKRLLVSLYVLLAAVCSLQADQVSETEARQVANRFFSQRASRFTSPSAPSATRLAFTAERGRFYVYDCGARDGFVIVAGDDRLPQVLGYGEKGDFSAPALPAAVQYWMDELNRQIAYLQAHGDVAAHRPAKRASAVEPLLTTRWNQDAPYNNYCPTYGNNSRAVTGCVATATAQVMNYYQWPPVGRGSHSYFCNVGGVTPTQLSADFSQSVYRWDLMLDDYDENSSSESCDAVARLMSDVGISMDMDYGSSSGARGETASQALKSFFDYSNKCYWRYRNFHSAEEWDQLLMDELSASRPVMYCGNSSSSGHAFVLDGFDADGYFHVNWGWGGRYDGYFLVSLLAPVSNENFQYDQRGLFGLVPEPQADAIDGFLNIRGQLVPLSSLAPLGTQMGLDMRCNVESNMLDSVGYEEWDGVKYYYDLIPMKLSLYDKNGVECKNEIFTLYHYLDYSESGDYAFFSLPPSLEEGEYQLKVSYSGNRGENYDRPFLDNSGKDNYIRVIVRNDTAYFKDRFLYNTYGVESYVLPVGVKVNDTFSVGVKLSYDVPWLEEWIQEGPTGNVYLSLQKDGVEVATGPMFEVMVPPNTNKTFTTQITAPAESGLYELMLYDESGNHMTEMDEFDRVGEGTIPVYVLPECYSLIEDFETMTANNSTSDQNVQGRFTTWNFVKSGVRAPGEGKCNGAHAVMMKKPSIFSTAQPLRHNFFMAQAVFYNPTATQSKYTLEFSTDGGTTWEKAYTLDSLDVVDVEKKSQVLAIWNLDVTATHPAQFRISMIGGGNGATYVDDFALFYTGLTGDVNGDGEVNIADVNEVIKVILTDRVNEAADVNEDGEVNIADVNVIINIILS